jgi:hypothetical protein
MRLQESEASGPEAGLASSSGATWMRGSELQTRLDGNRGEGNDDGKDSCR